MPRTAAEPPPRPFLAGWIGPGILVVAILAAYHNTFGVPFLFDDIVSVLENESIQGVGGWFSVFFPRSQVFTAGRPLLNLSFALNYSLGGSRVTGYHVANLCFHVAAALVLWAVVRRTLLLGSTWARSEREASRIAFFAALLWALNPIQTACVTYISQRAESLMALCYLLTLYGFIRSATTPRPRWNVLTVGCCLAGMMMKEVMVTAPLMVLVFDRTFVAGSFRAAWRARARLYLGLAATSLVLFALFATSGMGDRSIGYPAGRSWFDYPRVETGVLLHYFRLGFWPSPLVFDYGEEVAVPPLGMLAANVLVLALVFAGIGFALRKRWAAGFLGCWFFLIFAPTSSVVPIVGQPIAENRLYLSLAAVAVALALAATTCLPRRAGTIALASLAIVFGWLTLNRNQVYHTELGIWADTVAKRPGSSRAHLYHASSLLDAGRLDDATRELQATLQLDPRNGTAYANLGYISFQEKRIDQALSHFQTAVALAPNIPSIRTAYGGALFHAGRREEALQQYLAAVRLRPALLTARMDAADLMLRLGRPAEAVTMFEETLRLYPNHAGVRSQFAKLQAALQSGTYTPAQPTPPP